MRRLPELLDEHQLAEALTVSVHTLRRWRYVGGGPDWIKLGTCVRYDTDDVAAWLQERKVRDVAARGRRSAQDATMPRRTGGPAGHREQASGRRRPA